VRIDESALPLAIMRESGEKARHVGGKSCTLSRRSSGWRQSSQHKDAREESAPGTPKWSCWMSHMPQGGRLGCVSKRPLSTHLTDSTVDGRCATRRANSIFHVSTFHARM